MTLARSHVVVHYDADLRPSLQLFFCGLLWRFPVNHLVAVKRHWWVFGSIGLSTGALDCMYECMHVSLGPRPHVISGQGLYLYPSTIQGSCVTQCLFDHILICTKTDTNESQSNPSTRSDTCEKENSKIQNSQITLKHRNSHHADTRNVDRSSFSYVRLEILLASNVDTDTSIFQSLGGDFVTLDGYCRDDDVRDGETVSEG